MSDGVDEAAGALLAVSSEKGVAQLCDARTGGLLRTFQDCHPCAGGLAATSTCVVMAESTRSFIHLWSWSKEQPQYRCQVPERLSCVFATADGAHCVAGAGSGKLYLWEVASGKLLYSWDGHFRPVTALAGTCADGFLLSAGEDAIINVWSFARLLRAAETAAPAPRPFRTWTAHTLSVTALAVAEAGHASLVVSASLDQTVRVWRLAEGVKEAVHSADLGAALTCVAADPTHAAVYSGATDGRVLHVSLLVDASTLLGPGGGAGAGGAGSGARAGLARHAAAVASLCTSSDGARVFSCAADGGYWVWQAGTLALLSRQKTTLRFDALLFVAPPAALPEAASDRRAPTPFAPFKKFVLPPSDETAASGMANLSALGCVMVHLRSAAEEELPASGGELPLLRDYEWAECMDEGEAFPVAGAGFDGGEGGMSDAEMRAQLAHWQKLNARLQALAWERQLAVSVNGAKHT
jgi:pre-rRNA-processing protein IPI3